MLRFLLLLALLIPFRLDAQASLPMDPTQWTVELCGGVTKPTATGDGGIQFSFPPPPGCVGTLAFNFKKPVALSGTITSNLTMQVNPGVIFGPADAGNTCPTPATTRSAIYAQGWDKHRTCPVGSLCANQRWYADSQTDVDPMTGANTPPTAYPLANGSAVLNVPVSFPSAAHHWINVFGEWNDQDQAHIDAFNAAAGNVIKTGQVFGAGCFFAHGVWATGPAIFKLYSFGWQ